VAQERQEMADSQANEPNGEPETAQQIAARFLAAGKTKRAAAIAAGCSERAVYRWLQYDQTFVAMVRQNRATLLDHVVGRLGKLAERACNVLQKTLGDEAEPAQVRVRAAVAVLTSFVNLHEHLELTGRVAALEQRLADDGEGWRQGWRS
jgi:hypothetical protein